MSKKKLKKEIKKLKKEIKRLNKAIIELDKIIAGDELDFGEYKKSMGIRMQLHDTKISMLTKATNMHYDKLKELENFNGI